MLTYLTRRLLLIIPTLIGITAVVFFVMALSPGGVGGSLIDQEGGMKADQRKALRDYYNKRYGLDKPLIIQYARWLNMVSPIGFNTRDDGSAILTSPTIKCPDLGRSYSKGRPVTELYAEALPITLLLNLATTPLIYGIAVLAGIRAGYKRGSSFDVGSGLFFLALWSIPEIWAGTMLIGFLANNQYLKLFPPGGLTSTFAQDMPFLPHWPNTGFQPGFLLDFAWHLALPIFCLTYGSLAVLSKLARGAVLDNVASDYVRTARAKGVPNNHVLYRHVLRNSLLPLITVAAGILPGLLSGAVIIEKIFSIPGMGLLTIQAIYARDRELVLAGTLIAGVVGLLCILIADLCYAIADPRVSYE